MPSIWAIAFSIIASIIVIWVGDRVYAHRVFGGSQHLETVNTVTELALVLTHKSDNPNKINYMINISYS